MRIGKSGMKLYPFYDVARRADQLVQKGEGTIQVFQQFECEACGLKNTIDESPNMFHKKGCCGSCAHVTNIEKNGCNYMIAASGSGINATLDALLEGKYKK